MWFSPLVCRSARASSPLLVMECSVLASDQVPKYLIPCYLFFCDMPIKCLMKIFSKMQALKCSPFCPCFSDYIIYIHTLFMCIVLHRLHLVISLMILLL